MLTASTDDTPALEGFHGHGVFTYALLDALGSADSNGDGFVDITELAGYIDEKVPEFSFAAFKQRQIPQMKIVGSSFPLAGKVALLTGADVAPAISSKPTHVVIANAEVRMAADKVSAVVVRVPPGTQVVLMEAAEGFVLVARDGKRLGYVDKTALAPLQ